MDKHAKQELRMLVTQLADTLGLLCETSESTHFIDQLPEKEVDGRFYVKVDEYSGLQQIHVHFGYIEVLKDDIDEEELTWYNQETQYRKVLLTEQVQDISAIVDELTQEIQKIIPKVPVNSSGPPTFRS